MILEYCSPNTVMNDDYDMQDDEDMNDDDDVQDDDDEVDDGTRWFRVQSGYLAACDPCYHRDFVARQGAWRLPAENGTWVAVENDGLTAYEFGYYN